MTPSTGFVDPASTTESPPPITHRPARRVRVAARTILVGVWAGGSGFLYLLGSGFLWPLSEVQRRWRRWWVRTWGRGIARIVGMRITIEGTPPAPPYLLVSNHLGYLDIIAYAATMGSTFVSRHDLRYWPGLGTLARIVGTVFIDRGRKRHALPVMEQIQARLDAGHGVVIFAEGTSSKGDRVYPLKGSLLALPAQTARPVHWAAITYRTPPGEEPAARSVCWWGDMTFGPHFLDVCRMSYFESTLTFGAEPIRETDRKVLAVKLQNAIAERFVPIGAGDDDKTFD